MHWVTVACHGSRRMRLECHANVFASLDTASCAILAGGKLLSRTRAVSSMTPLSADETKIIL
eukprot:3731792-Amphidinium_carterae.1